MKHRERVLAALNYEEPDRCPMQISFTPEFATRLKLDLGLKDEDFHNPHGGGNTYVMERTLDEKVTAIIHRIGVPTKDEIETLTQKVEDLTAAIDKLRAKPTAPRTRTAAKAKTASTKKK